MRLHLIWINVRSMLRGYKLRIRRNLSSGVFTVLKEDESIQIARPGRYWRYKRGIGAASRGLAQQYLLDHVSFEPGDVLIDCGANIGELGIWAVSQQIDYIAFEPENVEATCCDLNAYGGKASTNRIALWSEDTELKFYSKPNSADSSLIEISDYDHVQRVQAVRLSTFMSKNKIARVRLLKVEAEGAEPEVLMGLGDRINQVDFIAVDCGFERGLKSEATFNEVNQILLAAGFHVKRGNLHRHIYLFSRGEGT